MQPSQGSMQLGSRFGAFRRWADQYLVILHVLLPRFLVLHGLMDSWLSRERGQDFQTLVLGIGICIHRLGHRYVPRPGRPLTLVITSKHWLVAAGIRSTGCETRSVGGGRARSHGSNLLTCTEYCVQMYMVRHSAQTIVHLSETAEPMFVMA